MTSTEQTKSKSKSDASYDGFSADERAAMREHAKELKAAARAGNAAQKAAQAAQEVLDKIAEMPDADRVLAERVHAIVAECAPGLAPKLWYGMPAYARDGKIVCFFQSAEKFKYRYATLGFSDQSALDDGEIWATTFALTALSEQTEARIAALVRQATGAAG